MNSSFALPPFYSKTSRLSLNSQGASVGLKNNTVIMWPCWGSMTTALKWILRQLRWSNDQRGRFDLVVMEGISDPCFIFCFLCGNAAGATHSGAIFVFERSLFSCNLCSLTFAHLTVFLSFPVGQLPSIVTWCVCVGGVSTVLCGRPSRVTQTSCLAWIGI